MVLYVTEANEEEPEISTDECDNVDIQLQTHDNQIHRVLSTCTYDSF